MKKIFTLVVAAMTAICAFAQDYTHSAGLVVGSLNGLSYKYFISDELAIQADLGFGIVATSGSYAQSEEASYSKDGYSSISRTTGTFNIKANLWTFELAPNFIWQRNFASFDWADLDFFVGGGITLGYAQLSKATVTSCKGEWYAKFEYGDYIEEDSEDYESEVAYTIDEDAYPDDFGKFGINAIAGVEMALKGAPITIGLDFRPGYGLLFTGHNDDYKEHKKDVEAEGGKYKANAFNYSFFDWTLAATVRYTF